MAWRRDGTERISRVTRRLQTAAGGRAHDFGLEREGFADRGGDPPDGGITFPLAGELHAADDTIAELTAELQLKIRKYIPDAVVTVVVKAVLGNRVYVIGKVNRPGDFPLNGPLDVMQALALAGGATPFADLNDIRVLRRDGARQTSIPFRYKDIQKGKKLEHNILLQSGDTVVVP